MERAQAKKNMGERSSQASVVAMIDTSMLFQMMAERTLIWTKTRQRILLLQSIASSYLFRDISPGSKKAIADMISEGQSDQSTVWCVTAERIRALYEIVSSANKPNDDRLVEVIRKMRIGGAMDSVAHRPWFREVEKLLVGMLKDSSLDEERDDEEIRLPTL